MSGSWVLVSYNQADICCHSWTLSGHRGRAHIFKALIGRKSNDAKKAENTAPSYNNKRELYGSFMTSLDTRISGWKHDVKFDKCDRDHVSPHEQHTEMSVDLVESVNFSFLKKAKFFTNSSGEKDFPRHIGLWELCLQSDKNDRRILEDLKEAETEILPKAEEFYTKRGLRAVAAC